MLPATFPSPAAWPLGRLAGTWGPAPIFCRSPRQRDRLARGKFAVPLKGAGTQRAWRRCERATVLVNDGQSTRAPSNVRSEQE